MPIFFILLVLLALLTVFLLRFSVDEFLLAPQYHVVMIVALTLCGVVSSANWSAEPGIINVFLMSTNLVILATLLLVYYLFYYINLTYQQNLELNALQQRQKANEDLLALTQNNREELHILRHELKNHSAYIRAMLEQKRYDELYSYLQKDISDIVHMTPQVDSGNQLIDSVLNQKLAMAEVAGVRVECQFAVPETLPFSELEFCSLLANLMDNALEAAAQAEGEKLIRVKVYQNRGYLFLHIENSFLDNISQKDRLQLVTTKGNKALHGYGTKVIQRVVEQYNGYVKYTINEKMFCSDIMLAMINNGGAE